MAWTSPRTYTTGEVITAAILNTHVRDNFNTTSVAVAAAQGDIMYATAANALARLAKGTSYQHLRMNSGSTAPAWSSAMPLLDGVTAETEVANTSAETNLLSYSLAGNVLGTNSMLKIEASLSYLNNSASSSTLTLKLKYGGTAVTVMSSTPSNSYATRRFGTLFAYIKGDGTTSSQDIYGQIVMDPENGSHNATHAILSTSGRGAAAIDSTAAQTILLTAQHSAVASTVSIIILSSVIYLIDAL